MTRKKVNREKKEGDGWQKTVLKAGMSPSLSKLISISCVRKSVSAAVLSKRL